MKKILNKKTKKMDNKLQVKNNPQLIVGISQVENASKIATKLRDIINKQKLFTEIQGKKFVTVEGWNTLGAMIGVFPKVVRLEKLVGKVMKDMGGAERTEVKYLAEIELVSIQGQTITRAQAICSDNEKIKRGMDEYVIASMAQTRATGKAFRLAFSWIIKMAGYEATPAEEMDNTTKVRVIKDADIPIINQ